MAKTVIYPWNAKSKSADALHKELKINRVRLEGSTFKGSPDRKVINWGAGSINNPEVLKCQIINDPKRVALCTDKLAFFKAMSGKNGPRIPEWTDDPSVALTWFKKDKEVVARLVLRGHSGNGIEFFSDNKADLEKVLKAPLFTKYIKKKDEYRVHIVKDEVIDIQKKMLRKTDDAGKAINPETVDFRVRNLANGFIYGRNEVQAPHDVPTQALLAINRTGLDFGAVDVIWNDHDQQAYVIEVNTAPGLTGTTLENYVEAFGKLI
jgi:glutathione synthase/RimK-type ligase-like ATP-grasp enzyme